MEKDPEVEDLFELMEKGDLSPFELMVSLDIMGFDGDIIDYL